MSSGYTPYQVVGPGERGGLGWAAVGERIAADVVALLVDQDGVTLLEWIWRRVRHASMAARGCAEAVGARWRPRGLDNRPNIASVAVRPVMPARARAMDMKCMAGSMRRRGPVRNVDHLPND